jgi:cell division protein FtsB
LKDKVEKYREVNDQMAKSHAMLKRENRTLRAGKGAVVEEKRLTWSEMFVLSAVVV